MPPVLELTDEMVGPQRTDMSLAYLEGVMQWPDNPAERRNVIKAAHVLQMREMLRTVPASREALALDVIDAALALEKTPVALRKVGEERYQRGLTVGEYILGPLVRRELRLGPVQLESYKLELTSPEARARHPAINVKPGTFESKILPLFRPVGHLWAAHVHERLFFGPAFPCSLERLPWFLCIAEAVRQHAVAFKHPRRREHRRNTLLSAEEAWALPDGLVLASDGLNYVAGTPIEFGSPDHSTPP